MKAWADLTRSATHSQAMKTDGLHEFLNGTREAGHPARMHEFQDWGLHKRICRQAVQIRIMRNFIHRNARPSGTIRPGGASLDGCKFACVRSKKLL
ncbi:hypothetical protein [Burkholderia cenocepacia]|uniref:hypothetical protein n=1 Tax=Burkholderia cenocepacia TaxID=95486 RepID=UPI00406D081C